MMVMSGRLVFLGLLVDVWVLFWAASTLDVSKRFMMVLLVVGSWCFICVVRA